MKGMHEMKKGIIIIVFVLLLATIAPADTINGIDFDIPEEWQIADTGDSQNVYVYNNEVVAIAVLGADWDSEESKILNNLQLLDCESSFGENEGFYLMSDISEKSDEGFLTHIQECVFKNDGWLYGYLLAKNTGDAAITMFYLAPTNEEHKQITNFINLSNTLI